MRTICNTPIPTPRQSCRKQHMTLYHTTPPTPVGCAPTLPTAPPLPRHPSWCEPATRLVTYRVYFLLMRCRLWEVHEGAWRQEEREIRCGCGVGCARCYPFSLRERRMGDVCWGVEKGAKQCTLHSLEDLQGEEGGAGAIFLDLMCAYRCICRVRVSTFNADAWVGLEPDMGPVVRTWTRHGRSERSNGQRLA
jgi:hypothetical protein